MSLKTAVKQDLRKLGYGDTRWPGATKAIDESFRERPETEGRTRSAAGNVVKQ